MNIIRCVGYSVLILIGALEITSGVRAQPLGEARSVYVGTGGGVSFYQGDLSGVNQSKARLGASVGIGEVGYAFTPAFRALAGFHAADYRQAGKPGFRYEKEYWEENFSESRQAVYTSTWRYTAFVMFEYLFFPRQPVSPYLQMGGHATQGGQLTGWAGINETAVGPSVGLGTIVRVTDRLDLVLQGQLNATFPDRAVDGFTDPTLSDSRPFDLLGTARAGFRIRLNSSFSSVQEVEIHGPDELQTGQSGYYSADFSNRPSPPVTYEWNFGDGTRSTGRTVRHTYTHADTFEVILTVANAESHTRASETVAVIPSLDSTQTAPQPAGSNGRKTETGDKAGIEAYDSDISSCQDALEKAETHYQQQRFSSARGSLTPCRMTELPTSLRIETFRLIALSYLGSGNFNEARNAVLRILGADPSYTVDRVYDPPNYVALVTVVKQQLGYSVTE